MRYKRASIRLQFNINIILACVCVCGAYQHREAGDDDELNCACVVGARVCGTSCVLCRLVELYRYNKYYLGKFVGL